MKLPQQNLPQEKHEKAVVDLPSSDRLSRGWEFVLSLSIGLFLFVQLQSEGYIQCVGTRGKSAGVMTFPKLPVWRIQSPLVCGFSQGAETVTDYSACSCIETLTASPVLLPLVGEMIHKLYQCFPFRGKMFHMHPLNL